MQSQIEMPYDKTILIRDASIIILASLFILGFFFAVLMLDCFLYECVHSLGHSGHKLSLFAISFGDCSPIPFKLPFLVSITIGILALSDIVLFWKPSHAAFHRYLDLCAGISFIVLAFVSLIFMRLDFSYIHLEYSEIGLLYMRFMTHVFITLCFCGYFLIRMHFVHDLLSHYIFVSIPIISCIIAAYWLRVWYLPFFRKINITLHRNFVYPHQILIGVALAILTVIILSYILRRFLDILQISLLTIGIWSCAGFFFIHWNLLIPFHHMCIDMGNMEIQRRMMNLLYLIFAIIWVLLLFLQIIKRLRILRNDKKPFLGKNIVINQEIGQSHE